MAGEIGYDMTVTLVPGAGFPTEKMTLAQAVRTVVESPLRDKLSDVTIICESILIEGLPKIEAIYNRPDFPDPVDE